MRRSTDRILTTHVGSLPRPRDLLDLYVSETATAEQIDDRLRSAVAEVVRRQRAADVDVINDGEFGKPTETAGQGYGHGTWAMYIRDRLGGFDLAEVSRRGSISRDRDAFSEFYGDDFAWAAAKRTIACVGPVEYVGQAAVERDIANLLDALGDHDRGDAFLPVVSPSAVGNFFPNAYYQDEDEYFTAVGDAMNAEYRAIADAGLIVHIDDPTLAANWDIFAGTVDEYRREIERQIELLNHALDGIAPEQVRLHVCWGGWQGPHSTDLPLVDIVDLILKINVGAYLVEASNARHEHEWRLWEDVELPDGKLVIPGVVSHKTSVVEHPDLVADRIVRYAEAVGRENVLAGTDCGLGGRISEDVAWAKLDALVAGTRIASDALWK